MRSGLVSIRCHSLLRPICRSSLARVPTREGWPPRHTRIHPRRPRTNGKAERFIQTLLKEWAYVRVYGSSTERERQLAPFLER